MTGKKVMLTEIKVVGYQDTEYWQDNEDGPSIQMKVLDDQGGITATYIWKDVFDDDIDDEWNGGYWYHFEGGVNITKDNDVEIPAGHGYFVEAPVFGDDVDSINIQVAGEVITGDSYAVGLRNFGRLIVGNMMPTGTTVSQIEVQGYQDTEYWQDNEDGPSIQMKVLNDQGGINATYIWKDVFDDDIDDEWNGGYWYHFEGGVNITKDNDVPLGAGDGFFVEAPEFGDDVESLTLVFPGCLK